MFDRTGSVVFPDFQVPQLSKTIYSQTCVKRPLSKRPQIGFQDQLSLNAGQKYCRMLQGEHPAMLSTFIQLPFVIKVFVLSIFEWPFYYAKCTPSNTPLLVLRVSFLIEQTKYSLNFSEKLPTITHNSFDIN